MKRLIVLFILVLGCFSCINVEARSILPFVDGLLILDVSGGRTEDKYPNNGLTSGEIRDRIESSHGESGGDIEGSGDYTPNDSTSSYANCPIFVVLDENGQSKPSELYNTLQDLFGLIKIAAPVLVILLSTIDYLGAIAKSNDDEVKKATQRTVKRAIIGLAIFFLPFLLDILIDIFGLVDVSRCGIGS